MQPIRPARDFIPQAAAAAQPAALHPDRLEVMRLLDAYANEHPARVAERSKFANALKQCVGNPHNLTLDLVSCTDTEIQTCPRALSDRFIPLLAHQVLELRMPELSSDLPAWARDLERVHTLIFSSFFGHELVLHDAKLSDTLSTLHLHAFLPCEVTVRPGVSVMTPADGARAELASQHFVQYLLPTPRLTEAQPNPYTPRGPKRII